MPTNTTNQQITIPIGTDSADAPQGFIDQTSDIETRLVQRYTNLADRTARNPVPVQGELSILDTSTWYDRYTGAKWIPVTPIQVYKTASQNIINSIALTNDAQLLIPLPAANTSYAVEAVIYYVASTTGDIKFSFTMPAAATATLAGLVLATTAAGGTGDITVGAIALPGVGVISAGGAGVGAAVVARLEATVLTAGTTGNLQLQWAQNALDAVNATTVLVHSRLAAKAIS
jgi:hypothetical protein